MDFNTILDSIVIKNLKCTVCENYLSYFPIHITTDKQNICGRCDVPIGSVGVGNEIYELVASELRFPCRYNSRGCMEKLHPADIPSHEKECKLRVVKCPASEFGQCTDNIPLPDLKQHCEDKHGDILLKNGEFQMDLSVSEENCNILIYNNGFYIFKRNFDSTTTKFSSVVYNFEISLSEMYELSLNTDLRKVVIKGYTDKVQPQGGTNEICLDILKTPSCSLVEGKISFGQKKVNSAVQPEGKILEQLRTALKCSLCVKYVMPPIIFCLSPAPDNSLCYLCTSCYELRKLSGLDKVTEELKFPCTNEKQGCDFVSKPSILKQHELYCLYINSSCPLDEYPNCRWKGLLKDIIPHIYQTHSGSIATSSVITEPNFTWGKGTSFKSCNIIKFADILFRLNFSALNNHFRWTVQIIGEYHDSFLYELELVKTSKAGKLVTVQSVLPLTPVKDLFKDGTQFCYYKLDQINNVLSGNDFVSYKINIFKK